MVIETTKNGSKKLNGTERKVLMAIVALIGKDGFWPSNVNIARECSFAERSTMVTRALKGLQSKGFIALDGHGQWALVRISPNIGESEVAA